MFCTIVDFLLCGHSNLDFLDRNVISKQTENSRIQNILHINKENSMKNFYF